jgi:hypothetical protein
MDLKIVNPSNSQSGGVLILWRREISMQQIFSAPKHIDVRIIEIPDKVWRLTSIYGEPRWENKHLIWDRIRELNDQHNLPWAITGDFNEILFTHEKEGGNPRLQGYMQAFKDLLNDCELIDLGFIGELFLWKRGIIGERLDRVVVKNAWNNTHGGGGGGGSARNALKLHLFEEEVVNHMLAWKAQIENAYHTMRSLDLTRYVICV